MFISPTEPPALHQLGIISLMPEDHGVDVMWNSKLGTIGVQRKAFPSDFLSSIQDGRLTKEIQQMKQLDIAILLLEGHQQWTTEGELYGAYGAHNRTYTWTRRQHRNFLTSLQMRGIHIQTSDSITDTVDCIRGLQLWSDKGDHQSLDRRPNTLIPDIWGNVQNADYVRWLYQSLPGVGPKQAGLIYERLGMIFVLAVDEEDLVSVPGIGKGRARKIMEVFKDAE